MMAEYSVKLPGCDDLIPIDGTATLKLLFYQLFDGRLPSQSGTVMCFPEQEDRWARFGCGIRRLMLFGGTRLASSGDRHHIHGQHVLILP
jgi:hypothetical protein